MNVKNGAEYFGYIIVLLSLSLICPIHARNQDKFSSVVQNRRGVNQLRCEDISVGCNVTVSLLSDSLKSCLTVDNEITAPPTAVKGNGTCFNTPDWSDGTNGCDSYTANKLFCSQYGSQDFGNNQGSADLHCCQCGGGHQAEFLIGDLVLAKFGEGSVSKWLNGIVAKVQLTTHPEKMGEKKQGHLVTYTVVDEIRRSRVTIRDAVEGLVVSRPPSSSLMLKQCHVSHSSQDQLFRLIPVIKEDDHLNEDLMNDDEVYYLEHIASGLRVGSQSSSPPPSIVDNVGSNNMANVEKKPSYEGFTSTLVLGNVSIPLVFTRTSSRFQLFRIELQPHPSSSEYDPLCLIGGEFGKPRLEAAQWSRCADVRLVNSPYQQWSLSLQEDVSEDDIRSESCDIAAEEEGGKANVGDEKPIKSVDDLDLAYHIDWLLSESSSGRLGLLSRLPPFSLLGLERKTASVEVKNRFRKLARVLHPDKRSSRPKTAISNSSEESDHDDEAPIELLFQLIQSAYDTMKEGGDSTSEKISQAEVDQLLYIGSKHVVELDTESLQNLILNSTAIEPTLWFLVLYSARCAMSRMTVPLIELAAASAKQVRDKRIQEEKEVSQLPLIQFGAFGCGLHGTSRHDNKKYGIRSAFNDALCKELGMTETPQLIALETGGLGRRNPLEEIKQSFEYPGSSEHLAEKFTDFALAAVRSFTQRTKVKLLNRSYVQPEDEEVNRSSALDSEDIRGEEDDSRFESEKEKKVSFKDIFWLVLYHKEEAKNADKTTNSNHLAKDAFRAIIDISSVLLKYEVHTGFCLCESAEKVQTLYDDDDVIDRSQLVDCEREHVSQWPDIMIYPHGVGSGGGVSLLGGRPFSDQRDVEVALHAASQMIKALQPLSMSQDDEYLKDDDDVALYVEDDVNVHYPDSMSSPDIEREGQPPQSKRGIHSEIHSEAFTTMTVQELPLPVIQKEPSTPTRTSDDCKFVRTPQGDESQRLGDTFSHRTVKTKNGGRRRQTGTAYGEGSGGSGGGLLA